ncbi:hypothetical protein [Foetidibacter luteolus]|uniref:hypothetical protein n=1 Tax=Foetidibacter luteolus TaxID=2608880 RepID=UPI00129B5D84|nr:hypothetical protein [Foetidibacter luteolus]
MLPGKVKSFYTKLFIKLNIRVLFKRAWNSPTIMTWMSYFTKSANLLLILPLILKRFALPEVAIWYLFAAILSMSSLADFGFRNTFIRLFALAFGGARDIGVFTKDSEKSDGTVNWHLIERLYSSMGRIYIYSTLAFFGLLLALGSYSLVKPISESAHQAQAWAAWLIILVGIVADFYGKVFTNYLEGMYQIALVRRIETLFKIGSIGSSFLVLLFAPSLLNLTIAHSSWMVINVFRNRFLARHIYDGKLKLFKPQPFEKNFFKKIWQPAWRSGISGLMSNGLTNLTGIIYAQLGNTASVASYMIALRVITEIRNVSNAPFYSKIPLMAKLRAEGNYDRLIQVAQRGMKMTHIVFTTGVLFVGLFFGYFISLLKTDTQFVEPKLWLLMSVAFYVQRYGAMHMQLYNTTNHIIGHIADTIAGGLFIITSLLLVKQLQLFAIPVGMLVGYLGFYAWFAAYFSLKSLNISLIKFEYKVSVIPAVLFLLYSVVRLIGV